MMTEIVTTRILVMTMLSRWSQKRVLYDHEEGSTDKKASG
jgi:hypothetical protein